MPYLPSHISFICCAALILLGSCISIRPKYPAHWAPMEGQHTVQDLSGFYHPRLATLLRLHSPKPFDSVRYALNFSVDMQPSVRAQFICEDSSCAYGDDRILDLLLPEDRYTFKDKSGDLMVVLNEKPQAGNPMVGPQRAYCLVSRATDGALIVRKGAWARGLVFLLIPFSYEEYAWYRITRERFEMVEDPRTKKR